MAADAAVVRPERPGALTRVLRIFGDVRPEETGTVVLMFANVLILMTSYYLLRTVRDATILATGGAAVQSYASAGMALVLMGFIPLYSWFATRANRVKLVVGVTLFFLVTLEMFAIAFGVGLAYVAIAFFIWVGIFNNASVAQFWSYANDLYRKEQGERLFAVVAIGMTLGPILGAKVVELLYRASVRSETVLQVAAGLLLVHLLLYIVIQRREGQRPDQAVAAHARIPPGGGFGLVLASPYLRLVALLIVVLNVVNSNGNFIWNSAVVNAADAAMAADPSLSRVAFIGSMLGSFAFYQNVLVVAIQALLVSRIVKYFRMPGVLLALPLVALGGNALIAAGAGLYLIRWVKTLENATDYSVMNTGRQMLWLPTRREEKYKAKQAVDTFFVRMGDVSSAAIVLIGTAWVGLRFTGIALVNLGLVLVWLGVAALVIRRHRELSARAQAEEAALERASEVARA